MTALTPQQRAVMEAYVALGSMKQAAWSLQISEQTAKNHAKEVRRRLGGVSTGQAVYLLTLDGLRVEVNA